MANFDRYTAEYFRTDMSRFVEIGALFQIKQIVAKRADLDERQLGQFVCEPVWQIVEQKPNSSKDLEPLLGKSPGIPSLVIDCSYPGIAGGYYGYSLSVFDEELGLDNGQILQIEEWASEKEQQIVQL